MFDTPSVDLAPGFGHSFPQCSSSAQATMKQIFLNLKIVCLVKPDLENPWEKYRTLIADCGMTSAQEDIFLQAAWQFCEGIIDREFGLHPAQQVEMTSLAKIAETDPDLIESNKEKTQQ